MLKMQIIFAVLHFIFLCEIEVISLKNVIFIDYLIVGIICMQTADISGKYQRITSLTCGLFNEAAVSPILIKNFGCYCLLFFLINGDN